MHKELRKKSEKKCSFRNNKNYVHKQKLKFFINFSLFSVKFSFSETFLRGGSRNLVSYKVELNGWKLLVILTKSSVLDVAGFLDPLIFWKHIYKESLKRNLILLKFFWNIFLKSLKKMWGSFFCLKILLNSCKVWYVE